jgi:hypothetical protein
MVTIRLPSSQDAFARLASGLSYLRGILYIHVFNRFKQIKYEGGLSRVHVFNQKPYITTHKP